MGSSHLVVLFAAAGAATLAALTIRGWIKRPLKRLSSHTEFTPLNGYKSSKHISGASSFLPSRRPFPVIGIAQKQDEKKTKAGSSLDSLALIREPVAGIQKSAREITIDYQATLGEINQQVVMAYSRNLIDGRTQSINGRQSGEWIDKLFMLISIRTLTVLVNGQAMTVRNPAEIEALIDEILPLKGEAGVSQVDDSEIKENSQLFSDVVSAPVDNYAGTIRPFLPSPPPPPSPPPADLTKADQRPKSLADLLTADAQGFAILDLETTGKESGSCRIVEIAMLKMDASGCITEQWETLINPGCFFDNHKIHGITEAMVDAAPRFDAIAPVLAAKLDRHVLVAHNLHQFDGLILDRYFMEIPEIAIDLGRGIDTMPNPRRKLSLLCNEHGIAYNSNDCHTALGDVRALAALMPKLLQDLSPASRHVVCSSNPQLVTQVSQEFTRGMAVASNKLAEVCKVLEQSPQPQCSRRGSWSKVAIVMRQGLVFVGTQNKAPSKLVVLQQSEDHLLALGFRLMAKRARIIASDLPDFVLAPSLEVTSTKMKDAIRLKVPVVLCSDARQLQIDGTLMGWLKDG